MAFLPIFMGKEKWLKEEGSGKWVIRRESIFILHPLLIPYHSQHTAFHNTIVFCPSWINWRCAPSIPKAPHLPPNHAHQFISRTYLPKCNTNRQSTPPPSVHYVRKRREFSPYSSRDYSSTINLDWFWLNGAIKLNDGTEWLRLLQKRKGAICPDM